MMYNPYRGEDGQVVCWQEDLPENDPDFSVVARLTAEDHQAEVDCFRRVLAACRRHRVKILFNVGCWSPQTWFRKHPEAASRLPDDRLQFDEIFLAPAPLDLHALLP